jgi:DNA-binding SARP family transcriptional activator
MRRGARAGDTRLDNRFVHGDEIKMTPTVGNNTVMDAASNPYPTRTSEMSSFRILGSVEAWSGGRKLATGGARQVKVLAFLLLHANRAVSSDALIDAVWGPDVSASHNRLWMAVARLRGSLAPLDGPAGSPLRTVRGGYLLSIEQDQLDAEVFVERVQHGIDAAQAGEPRVATEVLSRALALWRGAPLAEVAFEDFAKGEIRRLGELRLVALEARIDADLQLGRHRRLIGELERLLPAHPTRERLAAQLMLALYRCERQAQALELYQRIRLQLAEQLGLEPGPRLKDLHTQILNQAPSLRHVAATVVTARRSSGRMEPGRAARQAAPSGLSARSVTSSASLGKASPLTLRREPSDATWAAAVQLRRREVLGGLPTLTIPRVAAVAAPLGWAIGRSSSKSTTTGLVCMAPSAVRKSSRFGIPVCVAQ